MHDKKLNNRENTLIVCGYRIKTAYNVHRDETAIPTRQKKNGIQLCNHIQLNKTLGDLRGRAMLTLSSFFF
jgi:hypothetical protein